MLGLSVSATVNCHSITDINPPHFMATLERALQIAVQAHAGQKDKSGAAYIFHPIRVMMRCTSPEAQIVGLLHDVVEDTTVTFEELEGEGFSKNVMDALRLLTHDAKVPYEDYIQQVKTHPVATEAKLADLEDNMDIRRLQEVDEKAVARFKRYVAAHRLLGEGTS
jgi:(p)ppGpp synthase/HD superfamily hydrolase